MNLSGITRREALARGGLALGAAFASQKLSAAERPVGSQSPFRYCLNTATIRGPKLGIVKEIEVAANAGYDAIEPWVDSIQAYVNGGGKLADLKKRVSDSGLVVESAIGFPEWIVDDEERRAKGFERAKREMDLVAQLGGKRVAAPPAGATNLPRLELLKAAERYRALLEEGQKMGIVPQLELWGFSQNLNRLGECVCVAMETGHPQACVLIDVFHLYKGGSAIDGLTLLGPGAVQVVHMNDYPAEPPRDKIDDSYRIFPGDGTAPITEILRLVRKSGGQKILSLELFNRKYWAEDPLEVARNGLAKMKAAAAKAS